MHKRILTAALAAVFIAGCAAPTQEPPAAEAAAYTWTAQLETLKRSLEESTRDSGVVITQTDDNRLKVVVPSDISFDVGRANIKRDMARVLDQIADGLKGNDAIDVLVVGHTDSTGGEALNDRLSVNRATAARDHLTARGLAAESLSVDGRGSHEPVADNDTAAGRAQNRRVELFVGERTRG